MSNLKEINHPSSDDREVVEIDRDEPIPESKFEDNKVIDHLDHAVEAAEDMGMSSSELIGLLFYYAHNLAQDTREASLLTSDELQK